MTQQPENARTELATVADELLDQIAALKRHYTELIRLIDEETADHDWQEGQGIDSETNAAELMAIEMALAGRSRDDVEAHIRDQYGVEPTPEMLDRVFERLAR